MEHSELVREVTLLRQEIRGLRSELRQFVDAFRELSQQKNEAVLTRRKQEIVITFSHNVLALPYVDAVGYRRAGEGVLEICTLLSTRELEPERKIIRLGAEIEYRFPDINIEFNTMLTPPGSLQALEVQGYQILKKIISEDRDL